MPFQFRWSLIRYYSRICFVQPEIKLVNQKKKRFFFCFMKIFSLWQLHFNHLQIYQIQSILSNFHAFRSASAHSNISSQMSRSFSILPSYHLMTLQLCLIEHMVIYADDILAMLLIVRGEHFKFLNVINSKHKNY